MRLSVAGWAAVAFGALLLVIAAAFFGPASTLQTKMTQRFLEAESARVAEQRRAEEAGQREQAQREAAQRQAAEEEARRRAQQQAEARQRQEQLERQAAEARQREQAQREAAQRQAAEEQARRRAQQEAEAGQRQQQLARQQALKRLPEISQEVQRTFQAYQPVIRDVRGFLRAGQNALRQVHTPAVDLCLDPHPGATQNKNIENCVLFLVRNPNHRSQDSVDVHTALYWRVLVSGAAENITIPDLISYIWIDYFEKCAEMASCAEFTELMDGNNFHHHLLKSKVNSGFAKRLLATMTPQEQNILRSKVYPDLRRLYDVLEEARKVCRAINEIFDCLVDEKGQWR